MSADPSLLIDGDFVLIRMALVDQVGWNAAAVLQRIHWRCQDSPDGSWSASHAAIAAQLRMSERTVRAATKLLRDEGWLECSRAGNFDPTSHWRLAGSARYVAADSAVTVTANIAVTPLIEKKEETPACETTSFDSFWLVFPRKIGKGAARRSWEKACLKVGPDLLLDRAEAYAAYVRHKKIEDGFVKHPATWLNQECWDDDLPRVPAKADRPASQWGR